MKKIDYQTTALSINRQYAHAKQNLETTRCGVKMAYFEGSIRTLETLAYTLSDRLHVDKKAFLSACGIK